MVMSIDLQLGPNDSPVRVSVASPVVFALVGVMERRVGTVGRMESSYDDSCESESSDVCDSHV